jgi:Na+-transporting NADH:ubiquinone oxidoreductase subunit NqrB
MRRLELLQWVGLLLGAVMWGAAHVVGYGTTEASCNGAGSEWGIDLRLWEGLINGLAGVVSLVAALAAVAVIVLTQNVSYESEPPVGRIRFFAIAALVANVLFIAMVALYAAGSIANSPCRQA